MSKFFFIGSTPYGMYQKLIEFHKAGKISFKYVKTFNMDEYVGKHMYICVLEHGHIQTHFFKACLQYYFFILSLFYIYIYSNSTMVEEHLCYCPKLDANQQKLNNTTKLY